MAFDYGAAPPPEPSAGDVFDALAGAVGAQPRWQAASGFAEGNYHTRNLRQFLAETGNWPNLPNRYQIYATQGRSMTDDEYYQYVQTSGRLFRAELTKEMARRDWPTNAEDQADLTRLVLDGARLEARDALGF